MAKLPADVRDQIARNTTQDVWEISAILNIILKEVEAREVSESVKVNPDNRRPPPFSPRLPAASSLTAQDGRGNRSIQCAYCQEYHFSASCDRVIDIIERKEILRRDRRCFMCLGKNHRSAQCDPNKKCRRCHGGHHQSICPAPKPSPQRNGHFHGKDDDQNGTKEQGQENNTRTSTAIDQPDQATTITIKSRHKVLLQTAVTYAQAINGSAKPVPVRVLPDSGSQRSYITNSLKKRLGLVPFKTETVNLNTFGDEHCTKQWCYMVQVSLKGNTGVDRKNTGHCFPKICSPLTTTLDLRRYPHFQGLQLSDLNVIEGRQARHPS